MHYFLQIKNGYVVSYGKSEKTILHEITETEYNEIRKIIQNRPTAPEGYAYRLTEYLEWELYELPDAITDETAAKAIAYDILMGVAE